ncbi:hypothetical protein Syun_026762 [Stephania yunnanensis]|uniref:Transcription factor CBF/NF-Y/archaeal histone domain-containing protein n=1 Tax=Stephania yunnanensis TaxID=152371 RepID=A0AAP0EEE3_9MAGN
MERGGSNGFQRLPKSNSDTTLLGRQQQQQQQHQSSGDTSEQEATCNVREQDRFMPIANVIRIMRRILPTHAKISDDAKETIQECVSEYISFITSEANDRCQREQRKTITAEDVLWAMGKLGFDDYIHPLTLYLHRYREFEGDRSVRGGGTDSLIKRGSMPELAAAYGGPAGYHMTAHHHHHHHHRGMFAPGPALPGSMMNGYGFRDGSSNVGAPGHNGMAGFDPYGQFKQ